MDRLILTFAPDDDGTAELHGCVQGGGFSGSGSAWFNVDALEAFCASLASYPIDPQSPPFLAGGYWDDRGGKLKETHLSIRVTPYDSLGALLAAIELREPAAMNEPAERARGVSTWLIVGYNDVQRFSMAFNKMLRGVAEEAVLTAA